VSTHAYQIRRRTRGRSAPQIAEAGLSPYSAAHALAFTVKTLSKARRMNDPGEFAPSLPSPDRKRCSSTSTLYPPRRDLHPAPGRIRRARRDLPLEGLLWGLVLSSLLINGVSWQAPCAVERMNQLHGCWRCMPDPRSGCGERSSQWPGRTSIRAGPEHPAPHAACAQCALANPGYRGAPSIRTVTCEQ
jgi:hypothetical protein